MRKVFAAETVAQRLVAAHRATWKKQILSTSAERGIVVEECLDRDRWRDVTVTTGVVREQQATHPCLSIRELGRNIRRSL